MSSDKSDSQDLTDQDNETYLQNYSSLFKELHKFKTSTEIELRVYQYSKEFGNQFIPFHQACKIICSASSFNVTFLNCSDVNKHHLTEIDIIDWLLQGDIFI